MLTENQCLARRSVYSMFMTDKRMNPPRLTCRCQILKEFQIFTLLGIGTNDIVQTNPGIKFLLQGNYSAIGSFEGRMLASLVKSLLAAAETNASI